MLRKFGYEMAPLLLALVLGDRLEASFRLALTMSGGNYATFADTASVIVLGSALGLLLRCRRWPGRSAIASRSRTRRNAHRVLFHLNQGFELPPSCLGIKVVQSGHLLLVLRPILTINRNLKI